VLQFKRAADLCQGSELLGDHRADGRHRSARFAISSRRRTPVALMDIDTFRCESTLPYFFILSPAGKLSLTRVKHHAHREQGAPLRWSGRRPQLSMLRHLLSGKFGTDGLSLPDRKACSSGRGARKKRLPQNVEAPRASLPSTEASCGAMRLGAANIERMASG
jgi:hypothetical protein